MKLLPASGERLWTDDDQLFFNKIRGINDPLLREAAYSLRNNGFVHLKSCVADSAIDAAVAAYEEWCANADPQSLGKRGDGRRPRVVNLHSSRDELKQLITRSDDVLRVLDFLFGYKTSVYTSLTFQYGTEQPIHRDTPVFRTEPQEFYFGVWFALEDADEGNGALKALKGGHKGGRVDPFAFAKERLQSIAEQTPGGSPLWSPYQNAVAAACREEGCEEVLIPAAKGDVVIWHPQLPHGGSPIRDPLRTRRSVVFHVTPENVPVYQADVFFNEHALAPRESSFKYQVYEDRQFVVRSTAIGGN